jgi:DNA adenine methylase
MERYLFDIDELQAHRPKMCRSPFRPQLLKWVGNKQRFAHEIIASFPESFGTYYEPFLGSGGVLGTLAPSCGVAGDISQPLIDIWQTLRADPEALKRWYGLRYGKFASGDRAAVYESIRARYNKSPNAADLLFLSRACYGGVVRFRQQDGAMSTPCGVHNPISPESFSQRVDAWHQRVLGTTFLHSDFEPVMGEARAGDLVYCDPPYLHTQSILYGAQSFSLVRLLDTIAVCKRSGVFVALSIDGSKKSGRHKCHLPIPEGLFEREVAVNCGRSVLRRVQMEGKALVGETVSDRLLLTW